MLEPPESLKSFYYIINGLVKSLRLVNQQETIFIIIVSKGIQGLSFPLFPLKRKKKGIHRLFMTKIGSSETIRKTTFNFYNYKQNKVSHKKHIDSSFLEWFIGFVEGDGSFIVSNQRLFFIINQKEEKVLHGIRTNLGFGKVSTYLSYSRYIVADRSNVDRLISLFNGNLLLRKTNTRFRLWLDARNQYSKNSICSKPEKGIQSLESFSGNGWLSGFIDAEGCFNVQPILDNRYTLGFRVGLRFILDQKNELQVLEKVQLFLEKGYISIGKLSPCPLCPFIEKKEKMEPMYRFTCTHMRSHEKLIEYLKNYPLRTLKKVKFIRWKSLCNYIKNRKTLLWQGKVLNRVENLIKNIKES